ncbi:hypothetical protein K402DRAFT_195469 [Aulographum hederae CBS 113979]|uniref:Uncharacterized protein n=1 Tax=Aulographum hederae CBS 113979 TaxID=1176131 RepID=A0A6G1GNX2_9PEZI|nr:hypothetical protein K402DRAFT_195469 [Aulographum hederae CBS 113979]
MTGCFDDVFDVVDLDLIPAHCLASCYLLMSDLCTDRFSLNIHPLTISLHCTHLMASILLLCHIISIIILLISAVHLFHFLPAYLHIYKYGSATD